MHLPQLVIFDMDGLIFDTERLFMDIRAGILAEYGYAHRKEDYIQTLGLTGAALSDTLRQIYGEDYPTKEISEKTRARMLDLIGRDGPPVKPGIKTLLCWLQKKRIFCCVASSTHRIHVEQYLCRAGLSEYFSHVIGGDEIAHSKPAPDIFLAACAHFNIHPARALVLEDSENGIQSAVNAGIPVICIPDLSAPKPSLAQKTAAVLPTAADVITYLESQK